MHHLHNLSSTIKDILQLFSKFLSKMVQNGILKTYTFLFSENYSYAEKNYEDIIDAMEEFKSIFLKICSELTVSRKSIIETDSFNLLNPNPLNNCIPRNDESSFTDHTNDYTLYSSNEIHDTIEQNIQFMTNPDNNICNNLSQGITSNTNTICSDLGSRMEFVTPALPDDNSLKQDGPDIDFPECGSISGLLKEDDNVGHRISFSTFKDNLNQNQNDLINVRESSCNKVESVNYSKNDSTKRDSLENNIDSLNNMKYSNCNEGLYNTLKEAINGDFLQTMKYSSVDTHQSSTNKNVSFNEHTQYSQCASSLQQIDLDILNNTNERINHALDRIFDDQFVENDTLLESECWNVDINLPSTEPMQSNIDLQSGEFELPSCAEDLKNKTIRANLNNNLVSTFENHTASIINNAIPPDLDAPLNAISNPISSALDTVDQKKYSNDFESDKYFCEHCGFICDTKLKLKIHLKRQHNVYVNNINVCDHCGKIFKRRTTLFTHLRIHRDIKPFKCQYCWKTFTQKITRDSHVQLHTGMYKFSCSICEKRFPTRAKLNFHLKSHDNPNWRCDICLKMFTTKQYLNVHKKMHNKPVPPPEKCLACIKCNSLFEKNGELLQHIKNSHPDITFVCYFLGCNRNYRTYKKLRNHIYKKHTKGKSAPKKKTEKFSCELCKIDFVEKSSYHRHNLLVHCEKVDSENSNNCVHCNKRFTTESSLNDHLEKFHNSTHVQDMNYSCSICGSLFYEDNALKEHMSIHSDYGTHLCPTCGSIFSQKSDFLVHLSIHDMKKQSVTRKYKCEMCVERFENKMELKQHELDSHNIVPNLEDLKPYACSYCDKRFTTRGKCNLHMETHSENRKYKCTKCSKKFYRRDLLGEHMNTHMGYRAHVCKICGLGFSQKSCLKAHEATHERKEMFTCDQCGKLFLSKQALNFHIKTHEGNYKYACEVCNKRFVRKCHFDLHILSHSNERPFKCLKCTMTYKTNKHLRDHTKKAHQDETNLRSLMNSIYAEDEVITQQSLLDEYIPPINPLESQLMFLKS